MAAVHTVNCEQSLAADNNSAETKTNSGLKNGTDTDEGNSEDGPPNIVVGNKVKSPNQGRNEELTIERFQDGGGGGGAGTQSSTTAINAEHNVNAPAFHGVTCSEMNNYASNATADMGPEDYGKMNDNMGPYGNSGAYRSSNYIMEHGGAQMHGGEMSPNAPYNQYASGMRPNYQATSKRAGSAGGPAPSMSLMTSGYGGTAPPLQRFMPGGPSLSQHGSGPTPTLNQLLQSPNPVQRYQNNYADYGMGINHGGVGGGGPKGSNSADMGPASQPYSSMQNWGSQRVYQHQQFNSASGGYRTQGGPLHDMGAQSAGKRPVQPQPTYLGSNAGYGGGGTAAGAQGHSSQPTPNQYNPQYSQQQQRYPSPHGRMGNQPYSSQQMAPQYSQQQGQPPMGTYDQRSLQGYLQQQHSPQSFQGGRPPPPPQQQQQQHSPQTQQQRSSPAPSLVQQQQRPASNSSATSSATPQSKDGCDAVNSSSSNPDISCSVDDVHSDNSNQSLGSNHGQGSSSQGPQPGVSPLRPTPSPSGSSGSRSMSPAAGTQPPPQQNIPMPPRPSSSSQPDNAPGRLSQSPISGQGYNQTMPQSHMGPPMYGGKMHPAMTAAPFSNPGQQQQQQQQYPQGNYGRGQGGGGMPPYNSYHGNSMSTGHPYGSGGRTSGGGGGYPPPPLGQYVNSGQYGGGAYGPPPAQPPAQGPMGKCVPSGAQVAAHAAVMAAANSAGGPGQPRHYVKQQQQQQQQRGYGGPPVNYTPSSRDSPGMPMTTSSMPPPATPTSLVPATSSSTPPVYIPPPNDNCCDASNESTTPMMASNSVSEMRSICGGSALSLGGASSGDSMPLQDEASQHSTASNASTADERAETPRPRKDVPPSHPPTPHSALPSPAASMSSYHDDIESVSSPSWPRTPASPVVSSQTHEYHSVVKRPDGLHKLYDLSEEPERRVFLDRLIQFNEERGSALTQCPTISKHPLDLYRLYLMAKERGGFLEVTKTKQWKEIAGHIGVGASSSGAYTLRKQYIKHLLPFECKFDRGGIDPQPIISQLESSTRKKNSKAAAAAAAPSPGSSNSQDAFQQSNSQSMDGFPTPPYGAGPPSQFPAGDYGGGGMSMGPPGAFAVDSSPHHSGGMIPNHGGGAASAGAPVVVGDSVNVQNPFADDVPHAYPRNGTGALPGAQYGYNHHQRPPNVSSTYGGGVGQGAANTPASPYTYPDQMGRGGPPLPQQQPQQAPPPAPQSHDQYGSEQFRRQAMVNHDGYGGGRPLTDPQYGPPGANYSSGRPAGHYAYGNHFDRDRYDAQGQGVMMTPHGADHAVYPPQQHRYGGGGQQPRPFPPGGPAPSAPSGPAPPPPPSPTVQGSQPAAAAAATTPASFPSTVVPQDPAAYQSYASTQQQAPPPPAFAATGGKMVPPHSYAPQGPKRHPDFLKPTPDAQYPYGGQVVVTPPQSPVVVAGGQMAPTPSAAAAYPGWRNDGQYPQYPAQGPPRDEWEHRGGGRPPADPVAAAQWPGMHQRYQQQPQPPPQAPPPQPSMGGGAAVHNSGYYYNGSPMHGSGGVVPVSPPNVSARVRMPVMRDKQQVPYPGVQVKMQPPSMAPAQYPPKREVVFPPNSVEAVPPLMVKRRRLAARDVSPAEAWRLMMALKSGLLCESTWALDVLAVLLFDDATILYFNLQHLPGLLDVLLDHFRRCLAAVFGDDGGDDDDDCHRARWFDVTQKASTAEATDDPDPGSLGRFDPEDKVTLLDGEDFTLRTRRGKLVKVVPSSDLFVSDDDEAWERFDGGATEEEEEGAAWRRTASHVQTQFESDDKLVRFVRVMDDGGPASAIKAESSGDAERRRWRRRRRRRAGDQEEEEEAYNRDEPSLYLVSDSQESLARRCLCISNILRSLSFVPGNDTELSKSACFLRILGRLLLLRHEHAPRRPPQRHYDNAADDAAAAADGSCSSLHGEREWWWDTLHVLRENTLVTLANVAGQLDLSLYAEEIGLPILDGLLHWAVCPAACAQDPLPTLPPQSSLSPQRLSLEALCKLSVQESNVDLLLATPPFARVERLFASLSRSLSRHEDQVVREFAVVLLHYLSQADATIARVIALHGPCISQLIAFIEQAEQSAVNVVSAHGLNMLRENPDVMGTSLDMLRRAAQTLFSLAHVPDNRSLFVQHQHRLLQLVTSQILDQHVASIVADVLFECSQQPPPLPAS